MPHEHSQTIKEIQPILKSSRNEFPPKEEIKRLVKALKNEHAFGWARRLLDHIVAGFVESDDEKHWLWMQQQRALCTYKDQDRFARQRFDEALEILRGIGLFDPAETTPETLALGGAVFKRKWETGGSRADLRQAIAFYRAAWEAPALMDAESGNRQALWQRREPFSFDLFKPATYFEKDGAVNDDDVRQDGNSQSLDDIRKNDLGYGCVNAAYLLDVLATQLERESNGAAGMRQGSLHEEVVQCRNAAMALRTELLVFLLRFRAWVHTEIGYPYWFCVTVAEALLGREEYELAALWLTKAMKGNPPPWERQTTFQQLGGLARLRHAPPRDGLPEEQWHPAWRALKPLLGARKQNVFSRSRGKMGLALSGGGFRAAFFHLGVLARLAEIDALRDVEVLSTVSGGSIVGVHYYLELKCLLESKPDDQITRDDYVKIVARLQRYFLAGVQRNLRMRTLLNPYYSLKMALSHKYSRSKRIGELYEQELYAKVEDMHECGTPRLMKNLKTKPKGESEDFKPKYVNWERFGKVPVLLINTTSLNSGHSWHFTASSMGEPPGLMNSEIDMSERYRRLWYEDAPEDFEDYPVGYAVAASACVPGLFNPLELENLYPGRTIRLVDGGVHDNQGVEGLLNEDCTFILCSDASGQISGESRPAAGELSVVARANDILMDRVREEEYRNLKNLENGGQLQGLFFIHLKKGLESQAIDWTDCNDPSPQPEKYIATTDYGIDKDIQKKLAAIRTDLDAFNEVEANTLMLSGYLMTENEFRCRGRKEPESAWSEFDFDAYRGNWRFLELEGIAKLPDGGADKRREALGVLLDVGKYRFFKAWRLSPALMGFVVMAGILMLLGLGMVLQDCGCIGSWMAQVDSQGCNSSSSPGTPMATERCAIALPTLGICALILLLLALVADMMVPAWRWIMPGARISKEKFFSAVGALLLSIGAFIHIQIFDRIYLQRGRLARLLRLK